MPIVDSYWLKEALKYHKKSIAQLCALEAAEIALGKISEIIKNGKLGKISNIIFHHAGIPIIVDPGTYLYTSSSKWRN